MEMEMPSIPMWLIWGLILLAAFLLLAWLLFGRNQQGISFLSSFLKIFGG